MIGRVLLFKRDCVPVERSTNGGSAAWFVNRLSGWELDLRAWFTRHARTDRLNCKMCNSGSKSVDAGAKYYLKNPVLIMTVIRGHRRRRASPPLSRVDRPSKQAHFPRLNFLHNYFEELWWTVYYVPVLHELDGSTNKYLFMKSVKFLRHSI